MRKGKFSPGNRNPVPEEQPLNPSPDMPALFPEENPAAPESAPSISPEPATETVSPRTPGEYPPEASPEEEFDEELSGEEASDEPVPPRKARRGSRTGTVIFYTLYILFILLFAGTVFLLNNRLKVWLTDYQLSQPTDKRDQVFAELFDQPDWQAVYTAAGLEDTTYEGLDAFTTYMSNLVGGEELTLVETSTGLSGNRKYFVKLGQESIASFLLEAQEDSLTGLPRWELGDVEVFFRRNEHITIRIQQGQTAYVNGIPLDESHTTQEDSLLAKSYLPAGVYPHRSYIQSLSGLLIEPQITVLDESGQTVTVTYDSDADLYFTDCPTFHETIPAKAQEDVVKAVQAFGAYLLGEAELETLTAHFDRTTDVWAALRSAEPFDQEAEIYEYGDETVTDYRQYAEDLFSVRVRIRFLSTPRPDEKDGESKDNKNNKDETVTPTEHIGEYTLIFRQEDGSWRCIGATGDTELKGASRVRITYVMDGTVISDYFYDTALRELTVPMVSAPQGRVFAGWYREQANGDASATLIPVFQPDETGLVTFSEDFTLESMTLYALFEDAPTETEVTE